MFFLFALSVLHSPVSTKETILSLEKALTTHSAPAAIHHKLSLAYLAEQEVDKSFEHFLASLETTDSKNYLLLPEETSLYNEALALYQDPGDPIAIAELLLNRFEKESELHPNYHHLNFLLASAYGNLGKYEKFITHFYDHYLPDHFLALKTKGIILLRLASHASEATQREEKTKKGFEFLEKALDKYPKDPSLYRLLYVRAHDLDLKEKKIHYLEKLTQNRVKIARGDIFFYVRESVDLGRRDFAETLLELAKETYQYSRSIAQAEEYLKQSRPQ